MQNDVKRNDWLKTHERDVTSQFGEDGVIEKIFSVIKTDKPWCVDIGAWDGKHRSNVYNLIVNNGWSAVLIETNRQRFAELQTLYKSNDKVSCINNYVEFEGKNILDAILGSTSIPLDFDFLCIDIDGNDYHIWESMEKYKPKVVVIEFNPTIPNHVSFVQKRDMSVNQGNSLRAIIELGKKKGYELVHATRLNAFFVKDEYFPLFKIADNSIDVMYTDTRYRTTLFSLYDGTVKLDGCDVVMWHGIKINSGNLQPVPRIFRVFPSVMSEPRLLAFRVWRKIHNMLYN